MVDHVDTSGEAKILRKIRGDVHVKQYVIFSSLDKCCGDGIFLLTMELVFFGGILELVQCYGIYLSDLPALGSL